MPMNRHDLSTRLDQSTSERAAMAPENPIQSDHVCRSELICLQRKNLLLMDLAQFSEEAISCGDPNELLSHFCGRLREISGATRSFIALEHESKAFLQLHYISSNKNYDAPVFDRVYPDQGVIGTCWEENRVVYEQDYGNSIYRREGTHQLVEICCVPMREGGTARGVLGLTFNKSQENFEIFLDVYERYAGILATLVRNAETHKQRSKRLENLGSMIRINQEIYESNDHRQIMDSICSMAIHGFHADRARVYRYLNGTHIGITTMQLDETITRIEEMPPQKILEKSAITWCVENLKPIHIRVGHADPREPPLVHAHRKETNIGCSYILPLVCCGKAWGVFSMHRRIGQPDFLEDEKRLLDLLASQLSLTIYRQDLMDQIEYQANFDQLTGLANRAYFEKVLKNRIEIATESRQSFGLLFLDLDGFKAINDTLGHDMGDQMLCKLSEKLANVSVDGVFVGRLGGDEFSVVTPLGYSSADTVNLTKKIIAEFNRPIVINDIPLSTHVSVGIASFPHHGVTCEDLLINADIAMYQSKATSSGLVKLFDPEFAQQHKRRMVLRKNLEQAIENNELSLLCQPKVCGRTGFVMGGEVLVRWHNPGFEFVSPAEWIPIAEKTGMMPKIGRWIMAQACKEVRQLKERGLDHVYSINISATQFLEDDFAERALQTIEESGAAIGNLEFEITETAMAEDFSRVIEKLKILREAGLSIAIDDFGIEYSSLSYLSDMPVSVLKIDKKFIDELGDRRKRALVEVIVLMAKSLGLKSVAEGVETEDQLRLIRLFGCDYIQGYYYSKPVSFSDFPAAAERINAKVEPGRLKMAS